MKNNLEKRLNDIVKVGLWFNIIILLVLIFYSSKTLLLTSTLVNIALLGSFMMINKYKAYFGLMLNNQKSARVLNNILGKL